MNHYDKSFTEWTDKEVLDEIKALNYAINVIECYGTSDIGYLLSLSRIARERGLKLRKRSSLTNQNKLKKACKLLQEVSDNWDNDKVIEYPEKLYSFDEVVADIRGIKLKD